MKYCTHCGNELDDEAVICVKCGCPTEKYNMPVQNAQPAQKRVYSPLAIVGFVFALCGLLTPMFALVGLICSIIAYKSAVADENAKGKTFTKAGIIVAAILLGLGITYEIIMGILQITGVVTGSGIIF